MKFNNSMKNTIIIEWNVKRELFETIFEKNNEV